jgi:hypothetical protein
VAGREVTTLVDHHAAPGTHSCARGMVDAPGVYLIRVEIGNSVRLYKRIFIE